MPKKKIPKLIKVAIYLIVMYLVCWGMLMVLMFSGNFPSLNVYERSQVDSLSFSPDGSKLMSIDRENVIQIWDINSGDEISSHDVGNHGVALWFPDGKNIGVNHYSIHPTNKGLAIYNTTNFNKIGMINGDFAQIYASNDFGIISTNFVKYYYDLKKAQYNISLWNSSTYYKVKQLNIPIMDPLLAISPVGGKIAYLPWGSNVLQIIDISNENITKTLNLVNQSVMDITKCYYIKWLEENSRIAMVANFKNAGIYFYYWNVSGGSVILKTNYSFYMIYPSFSPDGMEFIMSSGIESPTNVSVVDTITGEVKYSLFLSEKGVSSTEWSPDGSLIAAGSGDGIIKIWNAQTGEVVQTIMTPKDHRVPT